MRHYLIKTFEFTFELALNVMEIVTGILEKYPSVLKAVLYGSRAKGTWRPGSDIDLTLQTDDTFSRETLLSIMNDFDDSQLPYTVDVSDLRTLESKSLVDHINRVGKVLYVKDCGGNSEYT